MDATEEEYEDPVCGAPDEPIRRQRQMVGHLENIETSVTDQKDSLDTQVPTIVAAVKTLVIIGWIIAASVGLHVVRHW
jgi:hypothetical protein